MREKQMFVGASCAGIVSAGVSCLFMGLVTLIWCVWDNYRGLHFTTIKDGISTMLIASLVIWLWGWSFLYSIWRFAAIKRIVAFRVAAWLIVIGTIITFAGMIRLLL